jgi:hypothetical protein
MKISVTKTDARKAAKGTTGYISCQRCLLATAFKRHFHKRKGVEAFPGHVAVGSRFIYLLPAGVNKKALRFHKTGRFKPFRFEAKRVKLQSDL